MRRGLSAHGDGHRDKAMLGQFKRVQEHQGVSLVVEVDRGARTDGLERRVQLGTPTVDDNSGVTPKGFEQREVGENIAARSIQYDCGFVRRIDRDLQPIARYRTRPQS